MAKAPPAPEYDNDLRGVLFKNDRKEKDTHPDYKGSCEIDGEEYWLSAWIRESERVGKFMSLAFTPKDAEAHTPGPHAKSTPAKKAAPKRKPARAVDDADDDIPF